MNFFEFYLNTCGGKGHKMPNKRRKVAVATNYGHENVQDVPLLLCRFYERKCDQKTNDQKTSIVRECNSGEAMSMILWDINRPFSIAFKSESITEDDAPNRPKMNLCPN